MIDDHPDHFEKHLRNRKSVCTQLCTGAEPIELKSGLLETVATKEDAMHWNENIDVQIDIRLVLFFFFYFFFIFSCIEIAKNKFNEIAWQQLQLRAGISSNNNENQISLQLDELVSAWWRCECERAYNLCDSEWIIQQVVLKPLSRCFTLLFTIKCVCVCVY